MLDLKEVYPVNKLDNKFLETLVDPETGELLNQEDSTSQIMEKDTEQLRKTMIGKVKQEAALVDVIDAEIKSLQELKRIRINRRDNYKKFLMYLMDRAEMKKLDFGTFGATIKTNPPKLVIDNYTKLGPYVIMEVVEKTDKKAIIADLKAGKEVSGAKLEQGRRIDIF